MMMLGLACCCWLAAGQLASGTAKKVANSPNQNFRLILMNLHQRVMFDGSVSRLLDNRTPVSQYQCIYFAIS